MKPINTIVKILTALAAVAGIIYIIATYGDKIVAWAKELLAKCPCKCKVDDCKCTCECEGEGECKCDCECNCTCEETPAEEAAPAEEAPAEEAIEEVVVEAGEPVAEEADFAE